MSYEIIHEICGNLYFITAVRLLQVKQKWMKFNLVNICWNHEGSKPTYTLIEIWEIIIHSLSQYIAYDFAPVYHLTVEGKILLFLKK